MENHLLPKGGTEHTSTAPANSGYGVSISKIKPSIRTTSVLAKSSWNQLEPPLWIICLCIAGLQSLTSKVIRRNYKLHILEVLNV